MFVLINIAKMRRLYVKSFTSFFLLVIEL